MDITAQVMIAITLNIFGFIMGTALLWASFDLKKVWMFALGFFLALTFGAGSLVWLTIQILP